MINDVYVDENYPSNGTPFFLFGLNVLFIFKNFTCNIGYFNNKKSV